MGTCRVAAVGRPVPIEGTTARGDEDLGWRTGTRYYWGEMTVSQSRSFIIEPPHSSALWPCVL